MDLMYPPPVSAKVFAVKPKTSLQGHLETRTQLSDLLGTEPIFVRDQDLCLLIHREARPAHDTVQHRWPANLVHRNRLICARYLSIPSWRCRPITLSLALPPLARTAEVQLSPRILVFEVLIRSATSVCSLGGHLGELSISDCVVSVPSPI
jgi:hypothetical protein